MSTQSFDDLRKEGMSCLASHTSAAVPGSDEDTAQDSNALIHDGNKYFPYTSDFCNESDTEEHYTFYFRRPQRTHILTIAKAGRDKALDSQKEVLVQLALPGERAKLREVFDAYPLLIGSFGDEVFKSAGAGSVFRGK